MLGMENDYLTWRKVYIQLAAQLKKKKEKKKKSRIINTIFYR
jgi:hypothetical protein